MFVVVLSFVYFHFLIAEYHALDAIISETPADERAEHFKTSGNEAYSLAAKMKKELAALDEKKEKVEAKKLKKEEIKEEDKIDEDHYRKLKSALPKRFADALEYYGQALEQKMFSKHLKCQIYLNRAQVHLTMGRKIMHIFKLTNRNRKGGRHTLVISHINCR